jgi:polyadenylation factor subunit 2
LNFLHLCFDKCEIIRTRPTHPAAAVVAWHPLYETLFASGGADNAIAYWLTECVRRASTFVTHVLCGSVVLSPTCCLLARPFAFYQILISSPSRAADRRSQEHTVGMIESAHSSQVWCLDWHPLGHLLASGANDRTNKVRVAGHAGVLSLS